MQACAFLFPLRTQREREGSASHSHSYVLHWPPRTHFSPCVVIEEVLAYLCVRECGGDAYKEGDVEESDWRRNGIS